MNGTLKTVNQKKGWGFIRGADDHTDYFFHHTALKNARIDDLVEGQSCTFEDAHGTKGPRAHDVWIERV